MPGKQKGFLLNPLRLEIPKRKEDYLLGAGDADSGDARKSFTASGAAFSPILGLFPLSGGCDSVKGNLELLNLHFAPDSELSVLQQGRILQG